MAPKHQPAMVKMTLKAAAILSLLPGSLRLCHHRLLFCSRCLVSCEAGYRMLTADVRSWSPPGLSGGRLWRHISSSLEEAMRQSRLPLNSCHNHLLCFTSMVYLLYCNLRTAGLVHRLFISTLTTIKKHDTYWLTLLFLFLV